MTLYAQQNFTIVRQLQDPSTSGNTYYLQSVIRNAYTDEIIDTVDLVNKGAQRFKYDWKVPADPSGEGFFVSIVTSVYSDAAHTTKSTDYGDEESTHQVITRPAVKNGTSSGVGMGGGLARRDVTDAMMDVMEKYLPVLAPKEEEVEPVEPPEPKDYDGHFDSLMAAIKAIPDHGKPQPIDFTPILTALTSIQTAVDAIKIPPIDFKPVLDAINSSDDDHDITAEEIKGIIDDMQNAVLKEIKSSVTDAVKTMEFVTTFVTHSTLGKKNLKVDKGEKETKPIDIKKLST